MYQFSNYKVFSIINTLTILSMRKGLKMENQITFRISFNIKKEFKKELLEEIRSVPDLRNVNYEKTMDVSETIFACVISGLIVDLAKEAKVTRKFIDFVDTKIVKRFIELLKRIKATMNKYSKKFQLTGFYNGINLRFEHVTKEKIQRQLEKLWKYLHDLE